ncbi:WecB/TagA/CpsF family glycosyltransferase [Microbacterium sp. KUDC0406]|uniref:WecB/TagA/CpsF family glycosyltransferase n=1 Tax=Microbacterium sp. KUDC0406 TaxID=2909588 RepID=UPI001F395514|nr:WecB/TagA/CpsF family glycosyltransferase [Microbacterium sp. KUDC0406]UJP08875.1 WecB/TagA/CpsF family glycosyltransferase [Microbacterium sp. KUDC0406]
MSTDEADASMRVSMAGGRLSGVPTVRIAGTEVHLVREEEAVDIIAASAGGPGAGQLAVISINLDHFHHFRAGDRSSAGAPEHFNLIDGAPVAAQAGRMTGAKHPRLAGSDLIDGILDRASVERLSIGVIGGSDEVTAPLRARLAADWPGIRFAGHWTPSREDLTDHDAQRALAERIRSAHVDVLLVCLGKPRQEHWIDEYAQFTGARVLLAFGAVVDFLAGRVSRAPAWIAGAGFEWAWRLLREPRRLARRYLVQGPPAYLAVRRSSRGGRHD